jgi:hypothetical protein
MRQRFSVFNITASYTLASAYNDGDQPFNLPSNNYNLRSEWGRAAGVPRHSFNTSVNSSLPFGVYFTTMLRAHSGTPYNITTGLDNDGDGQTNDRPEGLPRNSGHGPHFFDVSFNISKAFQVAAPVGTGQLSIFVNLNNALNMTNPGTPSGVMTSPFFGRSFNGSAPREIEAGLRFQF